MGYVFNVFSGWGFWRPSAQLSVRDVFLRLSDLGDGAGLEDFAVLDDDFFLRDKLVEKGLKLPPFPEAEQAQQPPHIVVDRPALVVDRHDDVDVDAPGGQAQRAGAANPVPWVHIKSTEAGHFSILAFGLLVTGSAPRGPAAPHGAGPAGRRHRPPCAPSPDPASRTAPAPQEA